MSGCWSEVQVAVGHLSLQLVSEVRGRLVGTAPLTCEGCANSRWYVLELHCGSEADPSPVWLSDYTPALIDMVTAA